MKTLVIYDCSSIHDIIEEVRKTNKRAKFDYKNAQNLFTDFTKMVDWEAPDDKSSIALVTIDQSSERQQLFIKALSNFGILVENIDFRLAIPTSPIGVKFSSFGHFVDLSPYMTYILGMKTNQPMNVIVVTRTFGIYGPLMDYITKRGGHVYLAFFKRFLDNRWMKEIQVDNYKADRINFLNLEDNSVEILGVDLPVSETTVGLSSL